MLIYGPHKVLHKVGCIEQGRWSIWKNREVVLKRKSDSLTMQIIGEDSFCELPRIAMTKDEFRNLEVSKTEGISEFLEFWDKPPIHGNGANRNWELSRKIGYGPVRNIDGCLHSKVSLIGNILTVTVSSLMDESIKLVFNPTDFNGRVIVIPKDRKPKVFEFDSEEEASLVVLEPKQSINYMINLLEDAWPPVEYLPTTNDLIFAELNIDMPSYTVVSACMVVE